ncbi:hypothetical protein [Chitinimonas lacunae]|uniref:Uncharacterized protein n=1 Tax=Chitinimonas lacunae TaxID=1963018 RepID=A0ABV8MNQ4_9NEIS
MQPKAEKSGSDAENQQNQQKNGPGLALEMSRVSHEMLSCKACAKKKFLPVKTLYIDDE